MRKMDRRDFSKLSSLAFIGTQLLANAQSSKAVTRPVGYAAIGLGTISDIFMRACATSQTTKITALVTGHPLEKGAKYAVQYGMHCEYTVRAAEAEKHVLCEKPMAISSAECRIIIEACRKTNVKLMIGYRVQYDPTWAQGIEIIKSGGIGEIESFHGAFLGQQPMGAWRLNKKLAGGGPIFDLGIYPLNAIRYITGEEPVDFTAVVATREHSGRFSEVEQSMEWTMKLPSGIIASCGCSYGTSAPGYLRVNGFSGYLSFEPAFGYEGIHARGETISHADGKFSGKSLDILGVGKAPFQFKLEAEHFASCIRNDSQPTSPGDEGLKDLPAIQAIYKAVGNPVT
jgi:predicted dehydrogenase